MPAAVSQTFAVAGVCFHEALLVFAVFPLIAGHGRSGHFGAVHADEGMWVFNNLPLAQLKARYGFEPPPAGPSICGRRRSDSTTAAPGRSSRPTG